ncbi:hypothetical protein [Streptomyces sp. 8N706]|uniref:hypothetical protein n=1 Tax=Streptomyces sp. 8N706 TaxID=3457416 RepID=UPI003FCFC71B
MPSFACSMPLHPDSEATNEQELQFRPAAGARAGDSGILRYTLKPEGLPAVRGSLTVIAGRPELRVNKSPDLKKMAVGETFSVPIVIRNIGDVPARGVGLVIDDEANGENEGEGDAHLSAAARHSNCRYSKDASTTRCLLPDAVIAPGETMRVTPALRVKPNRDALTERVAYGAWAYGTREIACCVGSAETWLTTPGRGASLSLTRDPAGGKGATFTTDPGRTEVDVPVRNTADIEAFGATLRGEVGSSRRLRIGYRNNGPAETGEIRTVFIVPPGTEVAQAPYDPEAEEEMSDQVCRTKDHGRSYTCSQFSEVGEEVSYEFTLRMTSDDTRSGCVAVSASTGSSPRDTRVKDTERSNDTAPVQVAENGSFSCALPKDDAGGWVIATGIVAAASSALLVVRHRRRKASLSGRAPTPPMVALSVSGDQRQGTQP